MNVARGLLLALIAGGVAAPAYSAIMGFEGTGVSTWTVSGGVCPPTTSNNCGSGSVGNPYPLGSPTFVPTDAAGVYPIGVSPWFTAPVHSGDASQWIAPGVRADGTIDYPQAGALPPLPLGSDPLDFGDGVTFVFSTEFTSDSIGDILSFLVWVDGNGNEASCFVRLNGNCLVFTGPAAHGSYSSLSGFSVSIPVQFGSNLLEIEVVNHWRETGIRVATVPEPGSMALLAAGLAGVALLRRRRAA